MSDDIGQSVRDRLAATSAVTNLVGRNIFADVLPQGADLSKHGAIVVQVPEATPHEDLNDSNRIFQSNIVTLSYGRDRAEANAIAKAVRNDALAADLRGVIHGMTWQEVTMTDGPQELVEQPQDGSDSFRRLTKQDFVIWNSPI